MASNFRILKHQNGDNLHLKLAGNFDGTSAWEVFNTLKKRVLRFQRSLSIAVAWKR